MDKVVLTQAEALAGWLHTYKYVKRCMDIDVHIRQKSVCRAVCPRPCCEKWQKCGVLRGTSKVGLHRSGQDARARPACSRMDCKIAPLHTHTGQAHKDRARPSRTFRALRRAMTSGALTQGTRQGSQMRAHHKRQGRPKASTHEARKQGEHTQARQQNTCPRYRL
jgi:hypothetical protein